MKVAVLSAFGSAPEVIDVTVPVPGPGEVRVKVAAAAINGFDLAVAAGYLNGAMEHRFPVVLGKDFAGTVDALGEGVDSYAVGDRVFGVVTKDFLGDGSFGEHVTVPVAVGLARLPDSVAFVDAAALGLAGTAAHDAVAASGIEPGATVLIVGATGGVGQQALQLAALAGASVTATASTEAEVAAVTALGASHVVDHAADVVAQVRELHPGGVDVVLHLAGDAAALAGLVRPGGVLVSTLLQDPAQLPVEGIGVVPVYANPSTATLERLAGNQADGTTTVTVQRTYTLDEAPQALTDFAGGTLGKLVISVG